MRGLSRHYVKVMAGGRVTFPAQLRRELGIVGRTVMEVRIESGQIIMHQKRPVKEVRGMLKRRRNGIMQEQRDVTTKDKVSTAPGEGSSLEVAPKNRRLGSRGRIRTY
jgi:bifunctional DNA-binding transcriptional regulator/antitoxin component of YhaV-PrlF toxin-antitoxin module